MSYDNATTRRVEIVMNWIGKARTWQGLAGLHLSVAGPMRDAGPKARRQGPAVVVMSVNKVACSLFTLGACLRLHSFSEHSLVKDNVKSHFVICD